MAYTDEYDQQDRVRRGRRSYLDQLDTPEDLTQQPGGRPPSVTLTPPSALPPSAPPPSSTPPITAGGGPSPTAAAGITVNPPAGGAPSAFSRSWWDQAIAGQAPSSQTLKGMEAQLAQLGVSLVGNAAGTEFDTIRLPNGQMIDVIRDVDGPNSGWQWLEGGGAGPAVTTQGPGLQGPVSPPTDTPGGLPATPGLPPEIAQFYAAQSQAIQQREQEAQQQRAMMRDALMRLMGDAQQPVDLNDATFGPAAATYRTSRRREAGRDREALAERAAFLGLNSGGQGSGSFDAGIQGLNEAASEDIAGYEGNLAMGEYQRRRGELMQALQIANALGARTEATDLQRQMGLLDDQIRRLTLGQQQGQFDSQLGFNYAQLGQQGSQFQDTMGFNYNQLLAQMNRDALLAGLG